MERTSAVEQGTQPLILIVDDAAPIRSLVGKALLRAGFRITEAQNGRQALEVLTREKPDVVLLDVVMPELDGFAVCSAIRQDADWQHTPVIMMTTLQDDESINRAYDVGATDFIGKPFNPRVLAHRIPYILRAKSLADELRDKEAKLARLAYFDSLTDLPNREAFKELLIQAIASARQDEKLIATLFLDLDNFKRINDTLGHTLGDLLLQSVAKRLRSCLRASDAVIRYNVQTQYDGEAVARLGGDEFTILLAQIRNKNDAAAVAKRILDELSRPFSLNGHESYITPSIGIAIYPDDGDDCDTLLKNADTAMYMAKRAGKNMFHYYDESLNDTVKRYLVLDSKLHGALQRNEFSLCFQPQVNILTGEVRGVEALLRWHNFDMGLVSPAEFIPIAEENNLIIPIGKWVLSSACNQAKSWQKSNLKFGRIAVNIAASQFSQKNFVDVVASVLRETDLESRYLELEITENSLIKDVEGAIRTLRALKELGVRIAIDDFGTGYSNLSYLKKLPLDTLKIDQSFLQGITTNRDDAAIVTAIIGMASSMNLDVVAEGIETKEQQDFLSMRSCVEFQGFYFSRPLPANEMTVWLQQHRPTKKTEFRTDAFKPRDANNSEV